MSPNFKLKIGRLSIETTFATIVGVAIMHEKLSSWSSLYILLPGVIFNFELSKRPTIS